MKLMLLKEDNLQVLKNNLTSFMSHFNMEYDGFIEEYFSDERVFIETKYETEEFELLTDGGKPGQLDARNTIILHTKLNMLSQSAATDERLWSALALRNCWNYMQVRWPVSRIEDVKTRYFYNHGPTAKRSLMRNGLARLWWVAYASFDSNRENPYEYIEFWQDDFDTLVQICDTNLANNPQIIHPMLAALIAAKAAGISVARPHAREAIKYLNLLGGTHILDILTYDEIFEKVLKRLLDFR